MGDGTVPCSHLPPFRFGVVWGMGVCLQGCWVGSLMWVAGGEKPSKFKMRQYP